MNFENIENMQKVMIDMSVISQLKEGGIEAVIKMANKIGNGKPDFTTVEDEEYLDFIHPAKIKMDIYSSLISMKAMKKNKKDFIRLGQELQKLAQDMIVYGNKHKDDKAEDEQTEKSEKTESISKKLDEVLDKALDKLLDELK